MAFKLGDFTTGNAFYWQDVDLTTYAGNDSGLTPYSILLTDGAGLTARGFIGAVGAGETLATTGGPLNDGELSANPGLEAYSGTQDDGVSDTFTSWEKELGAGPGIADATADCHNGANAIKLYNSTATQRPYIYQTILPASLTLSKFSVWHKQTGGATGWIYVYNNILNNGLLSVFLSGNSSYTEWSAYAISPVSINLILYNYNKTGTCQYDDVSLKRVLDPPSTGVHIVSAYGGSVRAWASIDSGFNPNTITTASVYLSALTVASASQRQLVDSFSLTQLHNLVIANAIQAIISDNIALTQVHTLEVANASQRNLTDSFSITQLHNLTMQNAAQAVISNNITLQRIIDTFYFQSRLSQNPVRLQSHIHPHIRLSSKITIP